MFSVVTDHILVRKYVHNTPGTSVTYEAFKDNSL